MNSYEIMNAISGVYLGVYKGETEADALDAMARDAGYADYAEAYEVAPAAPGELIIQIKRPNHPNRGKLPVSEARKLHRAIGSMA